MKAGRELDALVAEKVMGFDANCFVDDAEQLRDAECLPVPFFSEDIAAAWEVVEKLKMQGYPVWVCQIYPEQDDGNASYVTVELKDVKSEEVIYHEAKAPTVAHAICLAALKAVE